MTRKGTLRIWPVLLLLLALFVLSLLAPSEWSKVTMRPIAQLGLKINKNNLGARGARPRQAEQTERDIATDPEEPSSISMAKAAAPAEDWPQDATAQATDVEPREATTSSRRADQAVEQLDSTWIASNSPTPEVQPAPRLDTDNVVVDPQVTRPELAPEVAGPPAAPTSPDPPAATPQESAKPSIPDLAMLQPPTQLPQVTDIAPPVADQALPAKPEPESRPEAAPGPEATPGPEVPVAKPAPVDMPTPTPPQPAVAGTDPSPKPESSGENSVTVTDAPAEVATEEPRKLEPEEVVPVAAPATTWPYPTALVERIESLAQNETYMLYGSELLNQLKQFHTLNALSGPETKVALQKLHKLADKTAALAGAANDLALRVELQRIGYGLTRRLNVWDQVQAIAAQQPAALVPERDLRRLPQALEKVDAKLANVRHGRQWLDYLLSDELKKQITKDRQLESAESRAIVKRILLRMDFVGLSAEEAAYLQHPEFTALKKQLQIAAAEPVNYFQLLADVERYEARSAMPQALTVAAAQHSLNWSANPAVVQLSRQLDTHYRNANVRISVSRQLVQRLLPGPERVAGGVDDVVLGAHTRGCSETLTRLHVRLLPSAHSWRFGLEANGEVSSETYAQKGPATFYTTGNSVFRAQKEVQVDTNGLHHTPAAAVAENETDLTGLETTFDSLPLIGEIAHSLAIRSYQSQSDEARSEVENRIASEASERFDSAVAERLGEVRQQFLDAFYKPMQKLAVNPTVLDMHTSEERMVVRYRLAGSHQLGAHTPRPQAPGNSLFSVQIHESALNNILQQLGWAGKEANLRDLRNELATAFRRPVGPLPEDFPDDVVVRFADQTPVQIAMQDGRVSLTLALAELSQGRNRWRDFTVRVHYRSAPEQPQVDLVRDQYVELSGKRLHFRDQLALRAIFSRVFSLNQPIDILSRALRTDRRLSGLTISQMAIDDGWLGVAVNLSQQPQLARRTRTVPQ